MKTIFYFRSLTFIFVLMMGLSVNACAPLASPSSAAPTQNTFSDLMITMERTACHGTCPVYKLTIQGNGDVAYDGQDFVQVKGKQTASLSPAQIQELVSAFEQAKFFTLRDYTHQATTDSPAAITSITLNGKTKPFTITMGIRVRRRDCSTWNPKSTRSHIPNSGRAR